ncbi:MAG: DODA-type extradiol aromatic ring-opening family dioxygenase, partial [Thiomonas sp.]
MSAPGLPTLFVSHGAPTLALEPGTAGPMLRGLGQSLPRPTAIVALSPHWMARQPIIGTSAQPPTIHDFGGFDTALYALRYPASGAPQLAPRQGPVHAIGTPAPGVWADAMRGAGRAV